VHFSFSPSIIIIRSIEEQKKKERNPFGSREK